MQNAKIVGGKTIFKTEKKEYSDEALKVMKEQDVNYLSFKRQQEEKKIEKVMADHHFLELNGGKEVKRKHYIFVDDEESKKSFDPVKYFDTVPEAFSQTCNVIPKKTIKSQALHQDIDPTTKATLEREKLHDYKELSARMVRLKKVKILEQTMRVQKQLLGKGEKQLVTPGSDDTVPVYKWKKERKK